MGAWGVGAFENDAACDYACEVAGGKDISRIEIALARVLATGAANLKAPDAEEALAAADILARLGGKFGKRDAYTASIDEWVTQIKLQPGKQLVKKALSAIARILKEPSELMELWRDSDEFDAWKASVEELTARLSSIA